MTDHHEGYIGQQFGNYRLVRLLGRGGFAEVYLGQHIFLETSAAIKVLHTRLAQSEQDDFLKEARTIAHLAHPNIIRVLDFGMQGNIPFLVIDYAPNGSLRERYPKGSRLPLEQIIAYTKQVAAALQYAHNEKLIHRDVKPENMLVGRGGEILLSDFGISIVAQTSQSQRTQEVIGSVPYMAPEQLQGHPRSASDQYALGIVVYEWLCGSYPFQGSFTEVYGQHLFSTPPPLHEKNPAVPADVEQVVMIALAKDPHQRFSSVQAFAHALEQAYQRTQQVTQISTQVSSPPSPPLPSHSPYAQTLVTESPSHTPPYVREPAALSTTKASPPAALPRRRISRRTLLLGLAGLAVAGVGGTVWYTFSHRYPPQGTLIYTYRLHSDKISALAWHGERIASASDDNTVQIWDATTGNNPHVYRGHKENNINALAWSPDGSRIASGGDDGTVQIWDASSATPAIVYKGHQDATGSGRVFAVAWSPDGKYIASGGGDGTVQIWNASTGKAVFTYRGHVGDASSSPYSVYAAAWSPDSSRVVSGSTDNTAHVWDALTGKNVKRFEGHKGYVNAVAWSPDGERIASASDDDTVQVWDAEVQGQALTYTGHSDSVYSIAWSSDSQYLASGSADKTVRVWNLATPSKLYLYKRHTDRVDAVTWGDSHRIASAGDDGTVQVWEGV